MTTEKIVDKIPVDTKSMYEYFNLLEREQWKEEDLDQFVSTPGMRFLIRQEKDIDGNNSGEAVKRFLRMARKGEPGELGGWATSYHERVRTRKRLTQLLQRWEYLVEKPSKLVFSYLPEDTEPKGRCYLLPGGLRESYADCTGFGINLGCENSMKEDKEVQFHMARQEYRYMACETSGHNFGIDECTTPEDYLREFLRIIMREGMAMYMGVKAKGDKSEFLERHVMADESWKESLAKAFHVLMECRTRIREKKKGENLEIELKRLKEVAKCLEEEVFTGEYSPAAMVGLSIARAIDPGRIDTFDEKGCEYCGADSQVLNSLAPGEPSGEREGEQYTEEEIARRRSLWHVVVDTSRDLGFVVFFQLGKMSSVQALVPPVVWEAFSVVRREEGLVSGAGFP
ncbi:MAG: hypothetical protein HXS41_14305 [Theionarchaea archaeon]|nr:hypothetical protein [Theionarchaea archaeon]MBU7022223.1 hypothetical protein [Theionarchaea archaeon]